MHIVVFLIYFFLPIKKKKKKDWVHCTSHELLVNLLFFNSEIKNWDASLIWKSILGVIRCTCKKAPNIKVVVIRRGMG